MHLALKTAIRQLLKTPGFTFTALATLAICVGVNLTIFSVVDTVLLRPLPFPQSDRLVAIFNAYPGAGVPRAGAAVPNYYDRRGSIAAFSSIAIYSGGTTIVGEAGSTERLPMVRVSPDFFPTLRVALAAGQNFTDDNLLYGADQVAILTHEYWKSAFAGDPHVLGKVFINDGLPITIIGVLPPDFHFLSEEAKFFRPSSHAREDRLPQARHSNNWNMIGRLAPGVSLREAQAQMDAFNAKQLLDDPMANVVKQVGYHTVVTPLHADHVNKIRPILLLLELGVLVLFLIGAVNLANLLLTRASGRVKDFSVRRALGASAWNVISEAMWETLLLATCGGIIGTFIAAFGVDVLRALGTDKLPLGAFVMFDRRIAAAAVLSSLLVGAILALPTIWFNFNLPLAVGLQSESRTGTAGRHTHRLRNFFIIAQIALAFVLLSGAGLLSLSLKRVLAVNPGFNPDHVLTGSISLPWKKYPEAAQRVAFVQRLIPAIKALPGVSYASINSGLPFTAAGNNSAAWAEDPVTPAGQTRVHFLDAIAGDYWAAMQIRLLKGRLFSDADQTRSPGVCIVDRSFADYYWPNHDPVGHRLSVMMSNSDAPQFNAKAAWTIVGVVDDVKQDDLSEPSGHGTVYFPFGMYDQNFFHLVVRTALPPAVMANTIRSAIRQLDPELPIDDVRELQSHIDDSLVARRSPAILAAIFAGVALILAAIGTYGVLAYAVTQRLREIGVRIALGARPAQIRAQFLAQGSRLLLIGTILGFLGAWVTGRAMQTVLFDVPTFDPFVLGTSLVVLSGLALAACLLPAVRAAKVDPMVALRAD